jgi:predicted dehydrogenase
VDIVYVATPPDTRVEMAVAAFAEGKHVFCEKPLALSLVEADRMLAAAKRADRRLGINFVMRYNPLYDLVRVIVTKRLLGFPQRFLFENHAGDLPAGHWFWNQQRSGGILVEHGVHFFDIFHTIFGEGDLFAAWVSQREGGQADRWSSALVYPMRVLGSFYHAFDKPSLIEHTWSVIECEQGSLRLDEWYPTRLRVDGILAEDRCQELVDLLPTVALHPLQDSMSVSANGVARTVTTHACAEISLGEKQAAYAAAVRDAVADFIAWTRDADHQPRVSGADGRAALALALDATILARRNPLSSTAG